jgi:hypothetical protein
MHAKLMEFPCSSSYSCSLKASVGQMKVQQFNSKFLLLACWKGKAINSILATVEEVDCIIYEKFLF